MTTCTKNYKVMNTDTQRYIRLNKCPKKACRTKENIFTNMNFYVISTKNWEDNLFNFMVASKDVNYLGRYLSSKYRTLKAFLKDLGKYIAFILKDLAVLNILSLIKLMIS